MKSRIEQFKPRGMNDNITHGRSLSLLQGSTEIVNQVFYIFYSNTKSNKVVIKTNRLPYFFGNRGMRHDCWMSIRLTYLILLRQKFYALKYCSSRLNISIKVECNHAAKPLIVLQQAHVGWLSAGVNDFLNAMFFEKPATCWAFSA